MDRSDKAITWRDTLKHWSLWLGTVATTMLGFFYMFPAEALAVWNGLPPEVKDLIPQAVGVKIGVGLMALSLLAKFVRQDWVVAKIKAGIGWLFSMLEGEED